MAGKRKPFFTLALVIALAGLAFFVFSRANDRFSTVWSFPDGSTLHLAGVDFTTSGHSYSSKAVSGWQAKAVNILPARLITRLGWSTVGGRLTVGNNGMATNLGFFTELHGPLVTNGLAFTRLMVFDENGNTFDGGTPMGTFFNIDGKNSLRVEGWSPQAFPRRGKTVGLRFYQQKQKDWEEVAEFVVRNPAASVYPVWSPEKLPATRTNDDLSISLMSLTSGLSEANPGRMAATNEIAVTQARFRIVQAGHTVNYWKPQSVKISDATGNHWIPFASRCFADHQGEDEVFSFEGALWPGEAAWKMRFEFSRTGDFQSNEVFTFVEFMARPEFARTNN